MSEDCSVLTNSIAHPQELGDSHQQQQGNWGQKRQRSGCRRSPWHIKLCAARSHRQHMMKTEQPQETIICGRGRLGTWAASQGQQRCPLSKDELFAKRSQLCHRPLHVTLWESDAAVTGYRRPLGENLLEAKNKTRGFFFFLILKEGYRSLLQKGTCHLFPLLLGISAIVCLLKETHKICLPASLTRALQEAPKL